MSHCQLALLLLPLLGAQASGQDKDKKQPDHFAEARKLFESRAYDKALNECNLAVVVMPKSHEVFLLRGHVHEALGKHQEAVADFSKVLELDTEVHGGLPSARLRPVQAGKVQRIGGRFRHVSG